MSGLYTNINVHKHDIYDNLYFVIIYIGQHSCKKSLNLNDSHWKYGTNRLVLLTKLYLSLIHI